MFWCCPQCLGTSTAAIQSCEVYGEVNTQNNKEGQKLFSEENQPLQDQVPEGSVGCQEMQHVPEDSLPSAVPPLSFL